MACARARLKKAGPVTLSPVLVSPPVMSLLSWNHSNAGGKINNAIFPILLGKERSRSQGPRGIVGLKRDNADDASYGVVATQTGELSEM